MQTNALQENGSLKNDIYADEPTTVQCDCCGETVSRPQARKYAAGENFDGGYICKACLRGGRC